MSDSPDSPFGHDTVKLRAVFVPEGAEDQISKADITDALGYGSVKIPAVFVPEGGARPGYPYVSVGQAEFRPDAQDSGESGTSTSSPSSSQSADPEQEDSGTVPRLPRTRYRFGAALSGDGQPALPPNPTLAAGQSDPVAAGIAAWRAMANPGHASRQRAAARSPMDGFAPAAASGMEAVAAALGQFPPDPPTQAEGPNLNTDVQSDPPSPTGESGLSAPDGVTEAPQGKAASGYGLPDQGSSHSGANASGASGSEPMVPVSDSEIEPNFKLSKEDVKAGSPLGTGSLVTDTLRPVAAGNTP